MYVSHVHKHGVIFYILISPLFPWCITEFRKEKSNAYRETGALANSNHKTSLTTVAARPAAHFYAFSYILYMCIYIIYTYYKVSDPCTDFNAKAKNTVLSLVLNNPKPARPDLPSEKEKERDFDKICPFRRRLFASVSFFLFLCLFFFFGECVRPFV